MASKRARDAASLGNRLAAIRTGLADLEAKNRTPAPDPNDATLENLRQQVSLLMSANWRTEQEQSIWDARYDPRYLPETLRASLLRKGTTAERNTLFGSPANDTERVALANQKIVWFNTDLGWEESYYAVTGLSGLTAKGLVAGTASGWYPTGKGPRLIYGPTASATTPGSGAVVGNWNESTWVNAAGWFSYSGGVFTLANAGRYRIAVVCMIQQGSGVADFHHYANGTLRNIAVALHAGQFRQMTNEFSDIAMPAGSTTDLRFLTANSIIVHVSTAGAVAPYHGEFVIEYIGPNLVSS